MALRRRKRNKKVNLPELNVNITALLDVLTVLLFFLVKSFTTSSISIVPPENLRLPASIVKEDVEESMNVILAQDKLIVGDQSLLNLKNGNFDPKDIGGDERTILKLKEFLDKEYEKKTRIFRNAGDLELLPPGKITIISDKRLKFSAVKKLLFTAAQSGYTDYQFVVEKTN